MATLSHLIKNAERITLDNDAIMAITNNQTTIAAYSELPKYDSIMDIFKQWDNFILFYETKSTSCGHWVCIVYHRKANTIELFDSYGLSDEQILRSAGTSEKLVNGVPYLTYLIKKSGSRFIYNQHRFQSLSSSVNTCGRYASLRSRFKHLSLQRFIGILRDGNHDADYTVSALTVMYSPDIDALVGI